MNIHRRLFTRRSAASLLVGGIAAMGSRAHANDAIEQRSVEIGGVRDPQLGVQLTIAMELGLFKQQGLDVSVHWVESGTDMLPLVSGNVVPMATNGANSQVMLAGLDIPVKTIAALSNAAATQGLVLAPGVHMENPRELEGKRLASPLNSPHIMMLAKLATEYGFDLKKIQLIFMEPPDAISAFNRGDVDGALTYEPFMSTLLHMGGTLLITGTSSYIGGAKRVLPPDDQLLYQHSVFYAQQAWIDEKPNTLKAVLRGLMQADAMVKSRRRDMVEIMSRVLHVSAEELSGIMNENAYGLAIDPPLARSLVFASDWLLSIGRIKKRITPAMVLEPRLLVDIDPSLVSWRG